jgi:hypothetical protein
MTAVADALLRPLPCLLCGRPPRHALLFVSKAQRLVGAPPGKTRALRYSLCRRCFRKRGLERAERLILDQAAAINRVN